MYRGCKTVVEKGNYAMLKTEDYRLAVQSLSAKGVMSMVTYADLFQYSLVIIGIITLCFCIRTDKKTTA